MIYYIIFFVQSSNSYNCITCPVSCETLLLLACSGRPFYPQTLHCNSIVNFGGKKAGGKKAGGKSTGGKKAGGKSAGGKKAPLQLILVIQLIIMTFKFISIIQFEILYS